MDTKAVKWADNIIKSGVATEASRTDLITTIAKARRKYADDDLLPILKEMANNDYPFRNPGAWLWTQLKKFPTKDDKKIPDAESSSDLMADEEMEFNNFPKYATKWFVDYMWSSFYGDKPTNKLEDVVFHWYEPNEPWMKKKPSYLETSMFQGNKEGYINNTWISVYRESRERGVSMRTVCAEKGLRYQCLIQGEADLKKNIEAKIEGRLGDIE